MQDAEGTASPSSCGGRSRAGTRTQARDTSQTPGLGRRFSWSRRKAGLGCRVSISGRWKGEQSVVPALWQRTLCHRPTQPSLHLPLSPSTATHTSNAAPCGLSSSAKCERSQPEGGGHWQRPGSSSPSVPPPRARDMGAQCPGRGFCPPGVCPPVTAHRPLAVPRSLGGVDPAHASVWWHLRDMVLFGCWLPFLSLPLPPFLLSFIFLPRKT